MTPQSRVEKMKAVKDLEEENEYLCHVCGRSFSSAQALGGHKNAHRRGREEEKRASPASTGFAFMYLYVPRQGWYPREPAFLRCFYEGSAVGTCRGPPMVNCASQRRGMRLGCCYLPKSNEDGAQEEQPDLTLRL
ncbi:uncharacterized protein LOC144702067 [Wolffia australiana]